jgi:hypothetical protein
MAKRRTGWGDMRASEEPPTPDPSPPLASLAEGGELMVWTSRHHHKFPAPKVLQACTEPCW